MYDHISVKAFIIFSLFFRIAGVTTCCAHIKLPTLIGNNMVLQRGKPLNLWGNADPGEKITVLFKGKKYTAKTSKNGRWDVLLKPQIAGGPYDMTISGHDTVNLNNLLIGDVWLCSGQSNMFFTTKEVKNADQELSAADYPNIRLFYVPTQVNTVPQKDVNAKWVACTPQSVASFSAVAYFFAKNLQAKFNVPIGLIESAYGGTPIEGWISPEGIMNEPQFGPEAASLSGQDKDIVNARMLLDFNKWIDMIERRDPAYTNATYDWSKVLHPEWKSMQLPAYFENQDKTLKDRDGILWFSKSVVLEEREAKGESSFHMGPVVNDDMVFVNGVNIGATKDSKYSARNYTLMPSILHAGVNIISIRVIDYGSFAGINGKPEQFYLKTIDKNIPLSGLWNYKVSLDTVFNTPHESRINAERVPCILYNAMIAPIIDFSIKGILWYQGESNVKRAYQYHSLFKRLIQDWRLHFKQQELPFLFVQLANNNPTVSIPGQSYWAELREAQAMALSLPETGMITAIDLGEATNIHYNNKQDVGLRLSLLAQKIVYGDTGLLASGPAFLKADLMKTTCILRFKNVGTGLKCKDGQLTITGFQAATGGSESFTYIKATISGDNTIKIESPDGKPITAIRYAWADNPGFLNLVNSAGLPAYPFRTDHFKEISFDTRYTSNAQQ
jgi:sialate O-acetylesterase